MADVLGLVTGSMPFVAALGIETADGGPDGVTATARWAEDRCTVGGALHGGYLMALADSVGAVCASFHLPDGAGTSTIESKTNFLRGVTEGVVTVAATPLHAGRRIIVVQTDIARGDGKLVTRTTQSQAVLAQK